MWCQTTASTANIKRWQSSQMSGALQRGVITKESILNMPLKRTHMLAIFGIKAEYIAGKAGRTWY